MTDEIEDDDDVEFDVDEPTEFLPDTLSSPDGQVYFGGDADKFLTFWMDKLGFPVEGAALLWGASGIVQIIHPETGTPMSLPEIAKLASKAKLRTVQ